METIPIPAVKFIGWNGAKSTIGVTTAKTTEPATPATWRILPAGFAFNRLDDIILLNVPRSNSSPTGTHGRLSALYRYALHAGSDRMIPIKKIAK